MASPPPPLLSAAGRLARHGALWAAVAASVVVAGCSDGGAKAGPGAPIVAQFGSVGTGPGEFAYPRAIDTDGEFLWVIDKTARVQRLDPATGEVHAAWTMPDFALGKPTGVTIAPGPGGEPAVYVPETHYQRITVYSIPGTPDDKPAVLAQFGAYGYGPGEFIYPTDVGVLTAVGGAAVTHAPEGRATVERVYVTEYGGNDRVSVFGPDHTFLFSFGVFESVEDAAPDAVVFSRPQSIAIDQERRRLVITDACNHRLGVFDLDGRLIRWIGSRETFGKEPGHFNYPYGLALCPDGSVLVSEIGNHRVQRIDVETGACRAIYCSMGRGEGEVLYPWGVALLGPNAYILDSGNNRVLGLDVSRGRGRQEPLAGGGDGPVAAAAGGGTGR